MNKNLINSLETIQQELMSDFFKGRKVIIATIHGKQEVLSPVLESLKMEVVVAPNLNTDQFGTFTGEIPRLDDPIITLRKKCAHARDLTNCDLVLASEGSFGAHPYMPFVSANEEILLLKDFENNFEILVRELSTDTNFSSETISNWESLLSFAQKVGFPGHALILKTENAITKGIQELNQLENEFNKMIVSDNFQITVETDMRAMLNPTRMKVIAKAASKLKNAILSTCPSCRWPNFTVKDVVVGLPCGLCQMPTENIKFEIFKCDHCGEMKERFVDKKFVDPMYCNYCNP